MSTPITWRNVTGPDPAQAAYPMAIAQQTLNGAFDQFSNIIKQREAGILAGEQRGQEDLKAAFLDRLQSVKTPEELAALGQLDTTGMTAATKAALRGAGEARLTSLRQGVTVEQDYNAGQAARGQAGLRDQIASLIAAGKPDEANAMIAANPGLMNAAPLVASATQAARTKILQSREDANYGIDANTKAIGLSNATLANDAAKLAASNAAASQGVDAIVNDFAGQHQATSANMRNVVQVEAARLGNIPLRLDGSVDDSAMTDKQKEVFNYHLKTKGLPTLTDITTGDTQAAAILKDKLKAAGYKPTDIARAESILPTLLNTSPTAAIGNDKTNLDRKILQQDAQAAEDRMKYGQVATPETITGLSDAALATINSITKPGSWRQAALRETVANFLQEGGIKQGEFRVLPSAETLKQIILRTKDSWIGTNTSEIEDSLKKWAESAESINGAKSAIKNSAIQRIRGVDKEAVK